MKHTMNIRLLFFVVTFLAASIHAQSTLTDATIQDACATLSQNAKDAKALGVIQAIAAEEAMPAAIRSRAMVFCALPFLQQMNTNRFGRIIEVMLTTYPDEGPAALGLTENDWLAVCPTCKGKGTKENQTACLECKGSGKVVELSPNVARRSAQVVTELRALATENIRFAEQSKKALALRSAQERLAALTEMLEAFPKRKDTEPLVKAREAALAEIAEQDALEAVMAERNRMRQARDAIFAGAEKLPHSGIPVLVRQIDAFLAQYPNSEHGIELEFLKSKQQSRYTLYTNLWRSLYALGGLIVVMFIASLIKEWIFNRKKVSSHKVPGLENLNADDLTDPLSEKRKIRK